MKSDKENGLEEKLNLETGTIRWEALQRFFARGDVLAVAPELDLVEVAAKLARDQAGDIEKMITSGTLRRALDEDARRWHLTNQLFWSVVVVPWILVQETD